MASSRSRPQPEWIFRTRLWRNRSSELIPDARWLLLGLANDEIGYIIPRRQWDQAAPYAYGRSQPQYGEVNSCGPEVAPLVMQALADCIQQAAGP